MCLLLEGSYPYVAGGVSTWTHDLILAHPDLRFHVVSLVADRSPRASRYTLPDNVTGVTHVFLQSLDPGRRRAPRLQALFNAVEPALEAMQTAEDPNRRADDQPRIGGLKELENIIKAVAPLRPKIGERILLNSEESWDMVVRLYKRTMPDSSFLDYFWSLRALMSGLFAVILAPLPPARLYHAISTGYAGLYAARARLETGRPAMLTEHGIYTNERRIEVLMAEWLHVPSEGGLTVEGRRKDLRDLWLDCFVSYARACYDACDLITTLYGGNQEMQRREGARSEKLKIVPNGVDYLGYSQVERDPTPRRPTVALIGRVVPIKDVKTYIRACGLLRQDVPDLDAQILGPLEEDPDYVAECRTLISHLGLENTITFAGRVRLTDWLGRIDAIALTSVSEAQPLVVLEAGAAGVPSVTTDVGSCRELIYGRDDESPPIGPGGAVTRLSSPQETAQELRALLLDPVWRAQCGEAIRARVLRYYDKRVVDKIYRNLYDELCAAPDRPGILPS